MAAIVKVLVLLLRDELPIPPLEKLKSEELVIKLRKSLPKTSVLPGRKLLTVSRELGV